MARCRDCFSIRPFYESLREEGDGKCSECYGTGLSHWLLDQFIDSLPPGGHTPCSICDGSGVCQTCSGSGLVHDEEDQDGNNQDTTETTEEREDRSDTDSGYSRGSEVPTMEPPKGEASSHKVYSTPTSYQSSGTYLSTPYRSQQKSHWVSMSSFVLFFGSVVAVVLFAISYIHNHNLAIKEKSKEIDHLSTLAEHNFNKQQLHEADKLFSSAFYKAKEFDTERANSILRKRNLLYTVIDVPQHGWSTAYQVKGSVFVFFQPGGAGGFYFASNDSGRFSPSEKLLKVRTSHVKEYNFGSIKSISDIAPYGYKHGPFDSQQSASMKVYFHSTNGKSHRIFIVH